MIIALPSTGVHSNGFSLVRKIFDIDADPDVLHTTPAELGGKSLGEALLAPTKIYVKPVLKCWRKWMSRASPTSPAAASMRIFPAA